VCLLLLSLSLLSPLREKREEKSPCGRKGRKSPLVPPAGGEEEKPSSPLVASQGFFEAKEGEASSLSLKLLISN